MGDCGCDEQTPNGVDFLSLPLLTGCPGDEEQFLVANAVGGKGKGKYARRKYSDIKSCIATADGYAVISDTVSIQGTSYQNDDLIGAAEVEFVILNKQIYTYQDGDFAFNGATGTIVFTATTVYSGDTILIPYKSA